MRAHRATPFWTHEVVMPDKSDTCRIAEVTRATVAEEDTPGRVAAHGTGFGVPAGGGGAC